MNKITVLSGKGGTGKSTVSGILVNLMKDAAAVDLDVDAANLEFFLKSDLKETRKFHGRKSAVVDYYSCINCGKCAEVCHFGAIKFEDTPVFDAVQCEGCGFCAHVCPADALKMEDYHNGDIFISELEDNRPFVHAGLFPGEDNSGKLVAECSGLAMELVKEKGFPILLCDGPPGTGCPVIASLNSCDYIIAVTEPSRSALHDLKRLEELKQYFKLEGGIIVNKSGLSVAQEQEVDEYLKNSSWDFLGKVPYSDKIRKVSLTGEIDSQIKDIFSEIIRNIHMHIKEEGV
jgi:MinD superfamily P-loop ATPase